MDLKARIQEDMKAAMRAKDQQRLGTIRLILAAIKQKEVDERITVTDDQVIGVLDKMLKQRRDSIEQYEKANRQDLVDQEAFEVKVIEEYLPTPLSENEMEAIIAAVIQETQATSVKDLGKVMAVLKPKMQGRADMRLVSEKLKKLLT